MDEEEEQRQRQRLERLTRIHLIKDLELLQLKGVHPDPIAKQLKSKPQTARDVLVRKVMNSISGDTSRSNLASKTQPVNQSAGLKHKRSKNAKPAEPSAFPREMHQADKLIRSCVQLKPKIVTHRSINKAVRQSSRDYNRLLHKGQPRLNLQETMR